MRALSSTPVARDKLNWLKIGVSGWALASGVLSAEQLTDVAAMRRLVEPHEIASTVSWLLGPGASAVTGANIPVDAGFICGTTWQAYGGLRK